MQSMAKFRYRGLGITPWLAIAPELFEPAAADGNKRLEGTDETEMNKKHDCVQVANPS